ncbi:hypothetical protein HPB48_020021 [Haemaphysalis longicornis]|uniref:Uncharacterized protein n=1 Tax=Haemaphysalis longicornis TaxID=44386 RepID=A0A9J6H1L4_HAELO|nr:hypothetical protein HPB48_020021 [Haemaphysalis longicornis]
MVAMGAYLPPVRLLTPQAPLSSERDSSEQAASDASAGPADERQWQEVHQQEQAGVVAPAQRVYSLLSRHAFARSFFRSCVLTTSINSSGQQQADAATGAPPTTRTTASISTGLNFQFGHRHRRLPVSHSRTLFYRADQASLVGSPIARMWRYGGFVSVRHSHQLSPTPGQPIDWHHVALLAHIAPHRHRPHISTIFSGFAVVCSAPGIGS